jgi:hypothetical protein
MIWHIFKKDWKLLWSLVAVVAGVDVVNAALQSILGHFGEPAEFRELSQIFLYAVLLAIAALTATVVYQDRIPGDTQDWLTRPLNRRDVLLAKLLFVALAVQGPLFLVDTAQYLWTGFPPSQSISAALAQGAALFCAISLPALLLASVTRNMIQALFGALGLVILVAVLGVVTDLMGQSGAPFARSGLLWMRLAELDLLALLATIFVLPPLFARRHLLAARILIVAAALLVDQIDNMPWQPLFAVQQWFSAEAPGAVALAFDPGLGRSKDELSPAAFAGKSGAEAIQLPLRVSGLAQGGLLYVNRAEIRLTATDGTVVYQGFTYLNFDSPGPVAETQMQVRQTGHGDVSAHQTIFFPPKDFARIRNQDLRLDIDYSLTRFASRGTEHIAALGGNARLPNAGWCKTRMDPEGDDVELSCLTPADPPSCGIIQLENPVSGQRNPPRHGCDPTYKPWSASILPPGLMGFGIGLPFRDLHGLAHYPVDGAQLGQAQVTIQFFSPKAHFTRHLTIPSIRLGDWETQPRQARTNAPDAPG